MTRSFLVILALGMLGVAGCNHYYGGEESVGKNGPYYGEKPGYFDTPQPGLGGKAQDN